MYELVISVLSLLILFPVLYFLPLSISKKGKIILLLIAFLLANIGLLARYIFQLWQIIFIFFVLSILLVYIFDKRFSNQLYIKENFPEHSLESLFRQEVAASFEDNFQENEEILTKNESIMSSNEHHFVEVQPKEDISVALNKEKTDDEIEDTAQEIDIEESFIEKFSENGNYESSIEINHDENKNLETNVREDEISFLKDRTINIDEQSEYLEQKVIESKGYLSEIEKMLESDSFDMDTEHLSKTETSPLSEFNKLDDK